MGPAFVFLRARNARGGEEAKDGHDRQAIAAYGLGTSRDEQEIEGDSEETEYCDSVLPRTPKSADGQRVEDDQEGFKSAHQERDAGVIQGNAADGFGYALVEDAVWHGVWIGVDSEQLQPFCGAGGQGYYGNAFQMRLEVEGWMLSEDLRGLSTHEMQALGAGPIHLLRVSGEIAGFVRVTD